jgi:hypothetical protein
MAAVSRLWSPTINRKAFHETCHPLSKPTVESPQLQAAPTTPFQTAEAWKHFPGNSLWPTSVALVVRQHRPVAQKQSRRPISGRPRSVTARDDQPSLSKLRLGKPTSHQLVAVR